jgi:hypothetical protein
MHEELVFHTWAFSYVLGGCGLAVAEEIRCYVSATGSITMPDGDTWNQPQGVVLS